MERRSFLKGILALTAIAVAPPQLAMFESLPTIWGDMIHDDAPGLNALLAGEPFHVENTSLIAENGAIQNGSFLIGSTLRIQPRRFISITRSKFKAAPDIDGPIMYVPHDALYQITYNSFEMGKVGMRFDSHYSPMRSFIDQDARTFENSLPDRLAIA